MLPRVKKFIFSTSSILIAGLQMPSSAAVMPEMPPPTTRMRLLLPWPGFACGILHLG